MPRRHDDHLRPAKGHWASASAAFQVADPVRAAGCPISPNHVPRLKFGLNSSKYGYQPDFLVHPQGAATRRVGTQFIAEVKSSAAKTRLIPFEFSTTQTYVLEFGNNYIRFFKDKGQILSGGSAYEISSPYLTAELFDIKFAQSADVMYITHPNHEVMKLSRTGHTYWTLAQVDFTDGPYLATNYAKYKGIR